MNTATLVNKKSIFESIVSVLPKLDRSERETLAVLLDEQFNQTILERSKEIDILRKQDKLIPYQDLVREFS